MFKNGLLLEIEGLQALDSLAASLHCVNEQDTFIIA